MTRREARPDVLGHPRSLAVLAATELWVALSIYGVDALLVLYMVKAAFVPGHIEQIDGFGAYRAVVERVTGPLSTRALAAQTFGLYVALAYLAPLAGGWLGDRRLGRKRGVAIGAAFIAAGAFALALDRFFLVGLGLLVVGRGGVTGNMLPQVGSSYGTGDRRRADGFQLYYTMVNLGAFIAPLGTGALAAQLGWHAGFTISGVFMSVALVVYLIGQRDLPADPPHHGAVEVPPLSRAERRRVATLLSIVPISTLVWIAQTQVWNVYNLWVSDHVELRFLGWSMPVPWLQGFDALAPLAMVPALIAFWRWQARRGKEPDDLGKMTLGAFFFAGGMVWLAAAPLVLDGAGKVPLLWALAFHVLSNAGWLYYVPLAAALFTRAAPPRLAGVMLAVNTLAISVASAISGRLGGAYEKLSGTQFWLLHAAIVGVGGIVLLMFGGPLRRALHVHEE